MTLSWTFLEISEVLNVEEWARFLQIKYRSLKISKSGRFDRFRQFARIIGFLTLRVTIDRIYSGNDVYYGCFGCDLESGLLRSVAQCQHSAPLPPIMTAYQPQLKGRILFVC